MTSRPTSDAEPEATSPLAQDTPATTPSGSSIYGGRPTFALTRRDGADGAALTLYELLPEDQATARHERLERGGTNRQLVIEPFEDVFGESAASAFDRWSWDGWTAVKITRLSGTRLRSILPFVRQTLESANLNESILTSDGDADIFLPEATGIRLALGFLGIKPIQRVDRMRAFCRGITRMNTEECYYWHAKCRSPTTPNGEKALRTLLTDHI